MNLILYVLLQALISFVVLMITGRIYSKFSSSAEFTWQDDAKASATICVVVFLAQLLGLVIPQVHYVIPLLYIGLIYVAFQMEGIIDLIFFYVIYRIFNFIFQFYFIGMMGFTPFPSSEVSGLSGSISILAHEIYPFFC